MCTVTFALWVSSTGKNIIPQKVLVVVIHIECKWTDVYISSLNLLDIFLAQAHLEVNKGKCSSLQQQETNSCFFPVG